MAPNLLLPNIPLEIILKILSNLAIKPLCRFKSVSKPWLAMIKNLIKTRLEDKSEKLIIASNTYPCSFYSLNPKSPNEREEIKTFSECWFKIVGSCNGVLLVRSSFSTLFFWNPFIRRHRLIPSPGTPREIVMQGLGYDSSKDVYKVIWVIRHIEDDQFNPNRAYVYNSISNDWKRIDDLGYNRCMTSSPSGVVFNGSPHWIMTRVRRSNVMVYFDPIEETFQELPIPDQDLLYRNFRLIVLGENLGGVKYNNYPDDSFDVWVMKDSSWSMLFVVPRWQGEFSARVVTPLCFTWNEGELSCEGVIVQLNTHALALYNVKENRYERIELPQDCDRFDAACYVETLASP